MSRRMSCSMTIDAVRDRTKTVTRRHVDTWTTLKPGARLTLIEKGMGLAKGAKQVVLAEVEIVDVGVEDLGLLAVETDATAREGFPEMGWYEFAEFWARGHGHHPMDLTYYQLCSLPCRRIEWRYIDEVAP